MTRGRAAPREPFDIGAVSRSSELVEALAARRLTDPGDDPAVHLLTALTTDVDAGAPPLQTPARRSGPRSRRRVVRTVVTLGVTAVVVTSAGVAAAGGGHGGSGGGRDATGAVHHKISERSVGRIQVDPGRPGGHPGGRPEYPPGQQSAGKHHDADEHRQNPGRGHGPHKHPGPDADLPVSVPTVDAGTNHPHGTPPSSVAEGPNAPASPTTPASPTSSPTPEPSPDRTP